MGSRGVRSPHDGLHRVLVLSSGPPRSRWTTALEEHGVDVESYSDAAAYLDHVADADPDRDCLLVVGEEDLLGGDSPDLEALLSPMRRFPTVLVQSEGYSGQAVLELPRSVVLVGEVPNEGGIEADVAIASLARARSRFSHDRRVGRFERAFDALEHYRWIVNEEGTIEAANRPAGSVAADDATVVDRHLWRGPWWDDDDRGAIRDAIDRAFDVGEATVEVGGVDRSGNRIPLDVVLQRLNDGVEDRPWMLVTARDGRERSTLLEELRRSEELHRVTLNNMTDTVLLTDDDGRFTYICPNVHFIFGYSVEEIEAMGTIDRLLGEDLFDRAHLEETGFLQNVECETTDKAGDEHTLLVNVKRVSIQDGTVLYSCRDITKRKQRERALSTLHRTTRELLYAESDREVAHRVVTDAGSILGLEPAAFFRYDDESALLRPVAVSPAFRRGFGPVHPIAPGDETTVGRAFVEGEPIHVEPDDRRSDATPFEADPDRALHLPVGDHGVLVVASDEPTPIDAVVREVADLLAATAEAALDRIERESALRERDRRLREQNRRLERADRINEVIRAIDRAIVRAETRSEIERAVCESLASTDRFAFAWIGESDAADTVAPRASAGEGRGYLDAVLGTDGEGVPEPSLAVMNQGDPVVVTNVAADPKSGSWRLEALQRDFQSVVSVPLRAEDATIGVLSVYAASADAFDESTRSVLEELGETVGFAITELERKHAMVSGSVTELEFRGPDPADPLVALAGDLGIDIGVEDGIPRDDGSIDLFVTVPSDPDRFLEAVAGHARLGTPTVIRERQDASLLKIPYHARFVAKSLTDIGVRMRSFEVDGSGPELRVVVDCPASTSTRAVRDVVTSVHPDLDLYARRERPRDATGSRDAGILLETLTDRQLEVLRIAHQAGYFESPRERSGEEVAEVVGISPQAFYQHVRAIQRNLFGRMVEEAGFGP